MAEERFDFIELDSMTREFMVDELDLDMAESGPLYQSKVLTAQGLADYASLLRDALANYDELWLADRLNDEGRTEAEPAGAALRLARTEFNRYYIRAICRRAEDHGVAFVYSYRARQSSTRRVDSASIESARHSAPRILANLRGRAATGNAESELGRVNSGLTARCGCPDCVLATSL